MVDSTFIAMQNLQMFAGVQLEHFKSTVLSA